MNIKLKTNKNFTTALNKYMEQYGEEFEILNGFHDSQMNFSDFIDGFIDKNVADVTIDANANASSKDIRSLLSEKGKSHDKLFAFNKIFYEMNKKYGLKDAREWLEGEYNGAYYLHDAPTTSYLPYSYKNTETIVVKYNGKILLTTFEDLYNLVKEPIELLSKKDDAYCKYCKELYVWDKDDAWTKVVRVIKKPKTEDFHWIKSSNGLSEIVTSNHPVITTTGDVLAKDIIPETHDVITQAFNQDFCGDKDVIYCTDIFDNLIFRGRQFNGEKLDNKDGQVCPPAKEKGRRGTNPIQNEIKIDYDFGWMVGFILAEGHFNHSVGITQNDNEYLEKAIQICEDKNWEYALYNHNKCLNLQLQSTLLGDVFKQFIYGDKSFNKRLAPNILQYNKEFLKGIVAGVIDGDGTCTQTQGRRVHIRLTSRGAINQLSFLMRMFGFTVREQTSCLYNKEGSFINSHLIYHMAFTLTIENEDFNSVKLQNHRKKIPYERDIRKSSNSRYTFGWGDAKVSNNEILETDDEFVYDISVETGHFMCNNILSHNCYAYDLDRLAREGLFFLSNYNAEPPKHLTTFIDDVIEFISYMSNRSSGAVGIPNILIWTYYFWKKDCETGYCIKDNNYYIRQTFQKLIYRLNQPFMRIDQTAFVNVSIFDRNYIESLFGGVEYPDGSLVIDNVDELIEHQKIFMEVVSAIRSENMFTFPVKVIAA